MRMVASVRTTVGRTVLDLRIVGKNIARFGHSARLASMETGLNNSSQCCVVLAAGEYYQTPIHVPHGAFVVAADGGLDHANAVGIVPDYIVGDFDSAHSHPTSNAHTVVLPPQKDDPDLMSTLKFAWHCGAREFRIYGALGGRIDHTISAIQLTALVALHGGAAYLYGDGMIVTSVCDGALHFPAQNFSSITPYVSVFAHSNEARGVTETGLKYLLDNAVLTNDMVQGVSNERLNDEAAEVSVQHGTLTVTFPDCSTLPQRTLFHDFTGDLGALDTAISSALNPQSKID